MPLATGQSLQNRYRVVSLLGQGGMGAVYRAWDTRLNIPMALKEMIAQPGLDQYALAQLRQQFQQEATVLARLDHPHLVDVTDFFEEESNAYLVMKFVEGENLAQRIERQGAPPEKEVLAWAGQLLDALAYCHSQGVIHRDVKPQNVIIRPDGRAVLVDFGLVKLWDPGDPRTKTAMRGMGTPEYAPPEQYDVGSGHTDPRSDVYSLGATLYHALTGQAPPTATQRMVEPTLLKRPRALNPRLLICTEQAVLKAMEPQPSQRFQSAQEMAATLSAEAPARTRIAARPTPPKRQPTKVMPGTRPSAPTGQKRIPVWAWAVGCVAVLALVVGVMVLALAMGVGERPVVVVEVTATPRPAGPSLGDTWTRPADDMVMVYIPAGEFEMGSTDREDEQPVHTVVLDGFWIDRTEVTNVQFAVFLNERGNQTEGGVTWLDLEDGDCLIERVSGEFRSRDGYADHPVIEVSWYGAAAYCEWVEGRLLTDAEWEYAARGPQGFIYPWGDEFDCSRGNFDDETEIDDYVVPGGEGCDGYVRTAPVGSFPSGASWCDALDMAGNVWEWVAGWYGDYPSGRQVNPTGPSSGEYRVLRGGSWDNGPNLVRGAYRFRYHPDDTDGNGGFRCARGSQ